MTNELGEHVTIVIDNNDMNPPHKPNIQTKFETQNEFTSEQIQEYVNNTKHMLTDSNAKSPKSGCIEMIKVDIKGAHTYTLAFLSSKHWEEILSAPAKLEITLVQKKDGCKCGDNCARNLATGGCTDGLVKRLVAPFLPEFYQER